MLPRWHAEWEAAQCVRRSEDAKAEARGANRRSANFKSSISTTANTGDGRIYLGFVIAPGKLSFEAFDCDERSLGIFPNQQGDDQEIPAFLRRPRR
jgi:hypothetical protein